MCRKRQNSAKMREATRKRNVEEVATGRNEKRKTRDKDIRWTRKEGGSLPHRPRPRWFLHRSDTGY